MIIVYHAIIHDEIASVTSAVSMGVAAS